MHGAARHPFAVLSALPDNTFHHKQQTAPEESFVSVEQPFAIKVKLYAQDAEDAYEAVLKHAGASKKRDAVDRRIVKEVKKGKACFKGSVTGIPGIIDSEEDIL